MNATVPRVWSNFAAGLELKGGGVHLTMYHFGYLQAMRQFSDDENIYDAVSYCIDFDLKRINLEGEVAYE